jgi:Cof subfamily protein (haloacid dehalogenase superfamily)
MTAKKQTVLCVDIDGTLIDASETIHPQDTALLQDLPDRVQLVLTTGRSLLSAKAVLRQNGLFKEGPLALAGVYLNGGAAYLPGEVLCTKHIFTPAMQSSLAALTSFFPGAAFMFFSLQDVFMVNPNAFARRISKLHHLEASEVCADQVPEELVKLMILDRDKTTLEEIKTHIMEWALEAAFSLPYAFEINPPGINKANTLARLLSAMGLEGLPVFTVGDGENDLSLFEQSTNSFAPSTAHPAVLKAADHILQREKDGLLRPVLETIL